MPGSETTPVQRLGRNFLFVAWIIAMGLAYLFFEGWYDQRDNPNQSHVNIGTEAAPTVRLRQNRGGHYVARGHINGEPVVFLLDTGATSVSVPESVASRLRLRPGAARSTRTANGTITVFATRLDSVGLGPIELGNVRAHINPHMQGEQVLLGMSFLRNLDFAQSGRELTLTLRN